MTASTSTLSAPPASTSLRRLLWILRALTSHWRRRPSQLAAMLIGLAIATALWSGVQALNAQARDSYDRAAALFGGPQTPMLAPSGARTIPQELYIDLRRAGWPVSPVLEGRVELAGATDGEDGPRLQLVGVEPITAPAGATATSLGGADEEATGTGGDLIAFMTPPGRGFVAPETMAALGLADGATPRTVDGQLLPPLYGRAHVVPDVVVVDIGIAQTVLQAPDAVTRLLVDPDASAPPQESLFEIAGERLRWVAPSEESDLERLTDSFHLNLTAFGLLSFIVGLFIVHAAIGLAFEQRLGALRTIRACGASARQLTLALFIELVGIALIAGVVGVVLGYLIAAALLPDVSASLRGLYGARIGGVLTLEPSWWAAGLGMSVAGAVAAAAQSLYKAARLPVIASAHPMAWRAAQQRWLARQAVGAVVLLAIAGAAYALGEGLAAAFLVLTGMMLGAALLLPSVLSQFLQLGERLSRAPVARWFWADGRQQLSGLSLALTALLLALATNIGVSTMVESFRATFTTWLDNRLAAEIYLTPANDAEAERILTWLEAQPEVDAALPGRWVDARVQGWPVGVQGFQDHATYRDTWPMTDAAPDIWRATDSGAAALVSEQLATRLDLSVDEVITLSTATGEATFRVAGVYPDYGNPKGQISLSNAALAAAWPEAPRRTIAVRTDPGAVETVLARFRARFDVDESRSIDQASLKAYSRRVFEQTFAITAALSALTLGVSAVALFASLLTLGRMRLAQLAPLWALGLTRRRLAGLELLKTVALAAMTAALAIPLGLALAWGLVAIVNVEAFGWRLPLYLFPWQWLEMAALAVAAAALAALSPVWSLRRTEPAALAKVFAQER